MKFSRYWGRAEGEGRTPDGDSLRLAAWGWSDSSLAEAQASAREKVRRMVERVARGGADALSRYGYGERPLREPVLEAPGRDGETVITRNSYGCEVLNTARGMFIDIDLPEPKSVGLLGRLLGRAAPPDLQAEALARIDAWLVRNPGWGFRAYRTFAGLRLLATHAPVDAGGEAVMSALGADLLYVRLCGAQRSYRARLTPKPWRCGARALGVTWPFADMDTESRFREWQEAYAAKSRGFATCSFLKSLGNPVVHPEIGALAELHDTRTRATSGLRLA